MESYFISFRPEIRLEENLPPFTPIEDESVQKLIGSATGVLLPAYVTPWRYRRITSFAKEWFPRLDTRFEYQGKTRQTILFQNLGVRYPETLVFENPAKLEDFFHKKGSPWGYPLVLKGDMGGGGETVFPIYAEEDLGRHLIKLPDSAPLLIQQWIEHGGKDLRVVKYGRDLELSYFRVGDGRFYNNVCRGGTLDHTGWPDLQAKGIAAVRSFCERAKIDIAGFDLMFPDEGGPVFIEINFHFGRKGLGGTKGHHSYILKAVENWRQSCLAKA